MDKIYLQILTPSLTLKGLAVDSQRSKGRAASNMFRIIVFLGLVALMLSGNYALAQDSEALYAQKCANCHAKDGSGHTGATSKLAVPDLRAKRIVEMSDTDLYNSIAHGTQHKEYPHAFLHTGMTQEQVEGLAKYIRALQRSSQPSTPRTAAKP